MGSTQAKRGKELPETQQVLRYWVEICEQANGSVRNLPLNAVTKIHIPRTKKEVQKPSEEILQLKDGDTTLEAKSFEDLVSQLRARYPDDAYERRLHWVRDHEAEWRRTEAMNNLIQIFLPRVYLEVLYVIQGELEYEASDSKLSDTERERSAARRGIALIDAGEWKQRDTWVHFPIVMDPPDPREVRVRRDVSSRRGAGARSDAAAPEKGVKLGEC